MSDPASKTTARKVRTVESMFPRTFALISQAQDEIADAMALIGESELKALMASREYRKQLRARKKANG